MKEISFLYNNADKDGDSYFIIHIYFNEKTIEYK